MSSGTQRPYAAAYSQHSAKNGPGGERLLDVNLVSATFASSKIALKLKFIRWHVNR
jgi:hypothetical protein